MSRFSEIFWRFRFSFSFCLLYGISEWGFAHLSFKEGFFSAGSPNIGVFLVGGFVFILRFGVLFLVPAHLAYRVTELILLLVISAKGRPTPDESRRKNFAG